MDKIESIVKEYSSKKLKEIVEKQSSSYNLNFIDYAKDELIKRGERFPFDEKLEKEIGQMNDDYLKNLVEHEWNNFQLEDIEIARKEYLKRKYKNETNDLEQDEEQKEVIEKKYPALRTITGIYSFFAWIIGIATIIVTIYFGQNGQAGLMISVPALVVGALIVLGILAASESIKLLIDIEENTRKYSDD